MPSLFSKKPTPKVETLIIGAGTGIATAWALGNQPKFKVTVLESENRVGGHIHSLYFHELDTDQKMMFLKAATVKQVKLMLEHADLKHLMPDYILDGLTDSEAKEKLSDKQALALATALDTAYKSDNDNVLCISEIGAEFIGGKDAYPIVHLMHQKLGLPLKPYHMSSHIHNVDEPNGGTVFPPYQSKVDITSANETDTVDSIFKNPLESIQRLSKNKCEYFLTVKLIDLVKDTVAKNGVNKNQTLAQLIDDWKKEMPWSLISDEITKYADNIVKPLVGSSWGRPLPLVNTTYLIHYALNYLVLDPTWYDASKGLSSYPNKLAKECTESGADIQLKTEVKKLIPVPQKNGDVKYHVRLSDDTLLNDATGKPRLFDEVVLATPAHITAKILPDYYPQSRNPKLDTLLQDIKTELSSIPIFPTNIVIHVDDNPIFETPENTTININIKGDIAFTTAQKDHKGPAMKGWKFKDVKESQPNPKKILAEGHWTHPDMTQEYYNAEQITGANQNMLPNIQFATIAGTESVDKKKRHGGDSHEDRLRQALCRAAFTHTKHGLDPNNNERLKDFIPLLPGDNTQLSSLKLHGDTESSCSNIFSCC